MSGNSSYKFLTNRISNRVFVKLFLFVFLVWGLSSCAVYGNKFDCPPGNGAHCSSVEEIEQMVNNGEVWKVNGRVKQVKPKGRIKRNCGGKTCDHHYELDDGIRIDNSGDGQIMSVKHYDQGSS